MNSVELRQQPVVSLQAAGCQKRRRLHLAHVFGGGLGDVRHPLQGGAPAVAVRVLLPVPDPAALHGTAEPPAFQFHRQEAVLRLAYGEPLVLEVEGQFLEIPAFFFCHD